MANTMRGTFVDDNRLRPRDNSHESMAHSTDWGQKGASFGESANPMSGAGEDEMMNPRKGGSSGRGVSRNMSNPGHAPNEQGDM